MWRHLKQRFKRCFNIYINMSRSRCWIGRWKSHALSLLSSSPFLPFCTVTFSSFPYQECLSTLLNLISSCLPPTTESSKCVYMHIATYPMIKSWADVPFSLHTCVVYVYTSNKWGYACDFLCLCLLQLNNLLFGTVRMVCKYCPCSQITTWEGDCSLHPLLPCPFPPLTI